MTGSNKAPEHSQYKMSLEEARAVIKRLTPYKGRVMQPFDSPVNDFLILPAGRQQLLDMLDAMTLRDEPFENAIVPYKDSVVILVCPALRGLDDSLNHCSLGLFLELNDIDPAQVVGHQYPGTQQRA